MNNDDLFKMFDSFVEKKENDCKHEKKESFRGITVCTHCGEEFPD